MIEGLDKEARSSCCTARGDRTFWASTVPPLLSHLRSTLDSEQGLPDLEKEPFDQERGTLAQFPASETWYNFKPSKGELDKTYD